jgi:hypothetical protein
LTWGAFCLHGQLRQFCKGFAVLAWICVLYESPILRVNAFFDYPISPLAKLTAQFLEHPLPPNLQVFNSRDREREELAFFKIWNYWSVVNAGFIGGFFALQFRKPQNVTSNVTNSIISQAPSITIAPTSIQPSEYQ